MVCASMAVGTEWPLKHHDSSEEHGYPASHPLNPEHLTLTGFLSSLLLQWTQKPSCPGWTLPSEPVLSAFLLTRSLSSTIVLAA